MVGEKNVKQMPLLRKEGFFLVLCGFGKAGFAREHVWNGTEGCFLHYKDFLGLPGLSRKKARSPSLFPDSI